MESQSGDFQGEGGNSNQRPARNRDDQDGNWRRPNSGNHRPGHGRPHQNQPRYRGGGRGRGGGPEYTNLRSESGEGGDRYRHSENDSYQGRGNRRGGGRGGGGGNYRGRRNHPVDNYDDGHRQVPDAGFHRVNNNMQFESGNLGEETMMSRGQNRRGQPRRQFEERGGHKGRGNGRRRDDRRNRSELNPNAASFQPNMESQTGPEEVPLTNDSGDGFEKENRSNTPQNKVREKPRNQREALVDALNRNNHECMICCEKVRFSQPIWSCTRCFNVFHLACIKKWVAKSDDETDGWRCPSCQSCHDQAPDGYYCFCGKTKNPKSSRYDVPHTCGQVCGKPNPGGLKCTHVCNIQCHPGPCPSCEIQQVRFCGCGKTQARVLCGSKTVICCDNTCNKTLDCGAHRCSKKCHEGECASCEELIKIECHCRREFRNVKCSSDTTKCKVYSCSKSCDKLLTCGYHKCDDKCHPGPCGRCKTSPEVVISCPCGQTGISEACAIARIKQRTKCTDPVPTCGKICARLLSCGEPPHKCQAKCHLSKECPDCKLISRVLCRCGTKTIEIACKELKSKTEITCQKKCNKKRSCGKHKCNSTCCIDVDHVCPIVCQRPLRCGLHKCERLCHLNPCPPCGNVSFDELSCECGASIIYPPVPCGTRRPPCQLPCSREHTCDHPVHHPCHSETSCPPCTVLTEKWCHGLHELRKNVMCHITSLSCGLPCKKPLSCGRHKCPKVCHAGVCLEIGEICKLACTLPKSCGHACGAPCHGGDCPESKCKITTEVNCPCGRKTETMVCWKRENEYDRTVTWEYHKEIKRLEEEAKGKGETVVFDEEKKADIMQSFKEKIPKSAVLECDKECAKLERNRKLAEALQLENPDLTTTSIGTPNYSDFLMAFAKKNPQFIEAVHKQLTDLVIKAKQSVKKNVTYGFNSMNRDKRHVVHEYSDHFGVLSESFDEEPNRNVVCFASKEKSYLPTVSLVDAVFRPLTVRSERLKPHDDVTFRPEKRTQIVGPSSWNMRAANANASTPRQQPQSSGMVPLNIPATATGTSSDFPPL